jgi:hypothetical protein
VFLKGDILYRSPSSPEKQAVDKLDNAGFYWHSTSGEATTTAGLPASGIYQFTVKTPFVLPIMFSTDTDIPSDLAYILVDRLGLSRVNAEYTKEMHEKQGLTNFPTSVGNVACCSGSKANTHHRGAFVLPKTFAWDDMESNGVPGWIGARYSNEIEVVIYPKFARDHLEYSGETP